MIDFSKKYEFENDLARFSIAAATQEHPSGYGNKTLLVLDVTSSEKRYETRLLFDIRYNDVGDAAGVERLVKQVIEERYGVLL